MLRKRLIVLIISVGIVGGVVSGLLLLRTPVPAQQYQECLQNSQAIKSKQQQCEPYESLWHRTVTDPLAYFTAWLVLFTAVLALVSAFQGAMASQQIALARQEFIAPHRPKVATRFFRPNFGDLGPEAGPDRLVRVFFHILNTGEGRATVIRIGTRVFDMAAPYTRTDGDIQFDTQALALILESGAEERIYTDRSFPIALAITEDGNNPFRPWWCVGYIVYKDENGVARKTGFCRKWNASTKSWERHEDEDWEYSY